MGKVRAIPFEVHHAPHHGEQARQGPSATLVADTGAILGVGGVQIPWPGLGVAWLELFPEARAHVPQLWRTIVTTLVGWQVEYRFVRLQAHVDPHDPAAVRTAQKLGMVKESTMRRWGPGGVDVDMMAVVR
jgi:hypothetical protein